MLASSATFDARIAGMNLYTINIIRQIKGSVAIFSTSIDGLSVGAAGITEQIAKSQKIKYTVGTALATDKHPGKLPNTSK